MYRVIPYIHSCAPTGASAIRLPETTHCENFGRNYTIDVNNIIAVANINTTQKHTIPGLRLNVDDENRVYFAKVSTGNSITSHHSNQLAYTKKFLVNSLSNSLDFNFKEILTLAGANVVDIVPDGLYVDLSPVALDKSTIIDLLKP
ncbi:MAG: hypothetical protein JXB07_16655 [Anaerolineae bacterium]|nr:hypothetical protein [Anaerolineae bacterium]